MNRPAVDALPPRVLIVNLSARRRGMAERSLQLASGLSGRVALAVLRHSPLHIEAKRRGLEVHAVGSRAFDPRILTALLALLRSENFDLVDSHDLAALAWTSRVVGRVRVPLVATVQDVDRQAHQNPLTAELFRRTDEAVGVSVDQFVAADGPAFSALTRRGVSPERILVLPGSVSIDIELPIAGDQTSADPDGMSERAWLRGEFGTPVDTPLVLAAGRFVEGKGHRFLIEALGELATRGLDRQAHLLLFGAGPLRQELIMSSVRHGVSGRVALQPFVDQVTFRRALRCADLFVHPGRVNELPSSLIEAAAHGRPLVTTRIPGVEEVVPEDAAMFVDPGDSTGLATAIDRVLGDRDLARSLGRASRQLAVARFDASSLVAAMNDLYRRLAQPS